MCRIFGFRSVIDSQVHHSLVSAENALQGQSEEHPDGWGVAYFVGGSPHVVKSEKTALEDGIFRKISGVVSSHTVLAHIRKATQGNLNILNTHPFQFGSWVFVHNGNIKNFESHREKISSLIHPRLKRFILGDTDSEFLFYYLLSYLCEDEPESLQKLTKTMSSSELMSKIKSALSELVTIIGEMHTDDAGPSQETYLTFVLTNGHSMVAHQGGKNLYYSTYKNKCSERNTCPSFSYECENATKTGKVNHLIFSSEPLSGENIWLPMSHGQMMAVDSMMNIESI